MSSEGQNLQMMEDRRELQVHHAEQLQSLIEDQRFKEIFSDLFIDAFAITNLYNAWSYDDAARRRYLEKSLARSVFLRFIDETLEDGRQAKISLRDEESDREDNWDDTNGESEED